MAVPIEQSSPQPAEARRDGITNADGALERTLSRDKSSRRTALRVFLAALAIVLGVYALWAFRFIVLAALVGVMIGVLPDPFLRWLHARARVPRGVGALALALLAAVLTAALVFGVYLTVGPEIERLVSQGPQIAEQLNAYKQTLMDRLSAFGLEMQQFDAAALAQGGVQLVLRWLRVGVDGLAAAVVVLMIAMFVMSNQEGYARGVRSAFPPRRRARVAELGSGAAHVLRRWFGGQLVVVMASGILTAVTMALIGVDYWLLIAALTVVLDFVPFIGAAITGTVALLLTLGTEPDKAIWVVLAFIAIQQIESDILLPIVMKGTMRLPEAHLLVFVVIMGSAFGILGIFIAPPVFAVLHYLYREAYVPWVEGRAAPD